MSKRYRITALVEVSDNVSPEDLAHAAGNRLLVEDDELNVMLLGDAEAVGPIVSEPVDDPKLLKRVRRLRKLLREGYNVPVMVVHEIVMIAHRASELYPQEYANSHEKLFGPKGGPNGQAKP